MPLLHFSAATIARLLAVDAIGREGNGEAFQRNRQSTTEADAISAFLQLGEGLVEVTQFLFGSGYESGVLSTSTVGPRCPYYISGFRAGFVSLVTAKILDFSPGLAPKLQEHFAELCAGFIAVRLNGHLQFLVNIFCSRRGAAASSPRYEAGKRRLITLNIKAVTLRVDSTAYAGRFQIQPKPRGYRFA